MIVAPEFQMMDFGSVKNMQIYHQVREILHWRKSFVRKRILKPQNQYIMPKLTIAVYL